MGVKSKGQNNSDEMSHQSPTTKRKTTPTSLTGLRKSTLKKYRNTKRRDQMKQENKSARNYVFNNATVEAIDKMNKESSRDKTFIVEAAVHFMFSQDYREVLSNFSGVDGCSLVDSKNNFELIESRINKLESLIFEAILSKRDCKTMILKAINTLKVSDEKRGSKKAYKSLPDEIKILLYSYNLYKQFYNKFCKN